MSPALGVVFTIEVDGRPMVAFEGKQLREANELSTKTGFAQI
jgi:hypothetical protein